MSKLKEFAEFLLEVCKVGFYDRREDENEDWITFTCGVDRHYDTYLVYNEFNSGDLRLKPKEEEKKKLPLEFSDITPNVIFRDRLEKEHWYTIMSVSEECIVICEGYIHEISYQKLMEVYEYSTDGKTWKGCYKYED